MEDPTKKQKKKEEENTVVSSFPAESSCYSKALTSQTLVNKLEKQLLSEREAKEKLQKDVRELQKMNKELCEHILS